MMTRLTKVFVTVCMMALFLNSNSMQAQSKTKGEKRFTFAEGTLGFDMQYMPRSGQTSFIGENGSINSLTIPESLTPRFTISGLHFWGHADFYITLPIVNILGNQLEDLNTFYSTGSETGAKIYPYRVKENRLAPYVGISWNLIRFHQNNLDGQPNSFLKSQAPLHAGLTYRKNDKLFDFGISYNHQSEQYFYLDRSTLGSVSLPPISMNISYRWTFDSSIKDAKDYDSGLLGQYADDLRKLGKASGFSFAVGLSASLNTASKYNAERHPFSQEFKISNSHLDLGIGYFFEKLDGHVNLSYRQMSYGLESYDLSQNLNRRTLGLEVYKFIADYHGFVPYIGLIPSIESYRLDELDYGEESQRANTTKYNTGLIFGWDIRQDDVQWYILRTNLRYFPNRLDIDGKNYKFNQFEFNFIQFVYYPGRHKTLKKIRNVN